MGYGEGVGGCHACIKYLLFAFNFLFWLMGCGLVGVGIWALVDKNFKAMAESNGLELIRYAAIALIVIGGVIMVVGFFGCCGAIRESQCLLVTFFICLLVSFVLLAGLGVWILVKKDSFIEHSSNLLEKFTRSYYDLGDNSFGRLYAGVIQSALLCCGAFDAIAEYGLANLNNPDRVPQSCVNDLEKRISDADEGKGIACSSKLEGVLQEKAGVISVVAVSLGSLLIMGAVLSMMLVYSLRSSSRKRYEACASSSSNSKTSNRRSHVAARPRSSRRT